MEETAQKISVQRVSANVKGNMDLELARCTMLVGKCGAGKNAVIDSLSLALQGEAWTRGLGRKETTLMALAPAGEGKLFSNVVLSDGTVCSWSTEGTPKTTTHRVAGGPQGLPMGVFVYDFAEGLLLGDSKKLQQAILTSTGALVATHKVMAELPQVHHELLRQMLVSGGKLEDWGAGAPPVVLSTEAIVAALDVLSSRKRGLSKQLSVLNDSESTVVPLSENELAEVAQLEELQTKLKLEPLDEEQIRASLALVTEGLIERQAQYEQLRPLQHVNLKAILREVETLEMIELTQSYLLSKLDEYDRAHPENPAGTMSCPICSSSGVLSATFRGQAEKVQSLVRKKQEWLGELLSQDQQRLELESQIKTATADRDRLLTKLDRLHTPGELLTGDLDEVERRLRELKTRDLKAKQELANQSVAPTLRAELDSLDAIKEVLEKQLGDIMESASAVVEKLVNQFLPKSIRCKFNVSGRKKDMVKVEAAISGGPPRDFRVLSGGQRATLNVAIASATIPPKAPPVRLLVVNEVNVDVATLRTMIKAAVRGLETPGGFTQAIFCTVAWTGGAPEGCSMIKIDREAGAESATFTQE